MFQRRVIRRSLQMGACATALLLCTTRGSTEPDRSADDKTKPDVKACKVARKAAKDLEQSAHLRQAREAFLACAKMSCSALVRQECARRYTQLGSDIPSIVPLVTDQTGAPRVDVAVKMDGELLISRLDGRALAVDPGLHEFTFSTETGVVITQQLMIVQGQRNQPVTVSLNANDKRTQKRTLAPSVALPASVDAKVASVEKAGLDKQPPEEPSSDQAKPEKAAAEKAAPEKSRVSSADDDDVVLPSEVQHKSEHKGGGPGALPWVLGSAGVAGIGAFGVLTLWGRNDNVQLVGCSPNCSPASIDRVRKLYIAGNISLGVGIAALGASVTWLALGSGSNKEKPAQTAYALDVQPTPSGALATVSGAF